MRPIAHLALLKQITTGRLKPVLRWPLCWKPPNRHQHEWLAMRVRGKVCEVPVAQTFGFFPKFIFILIPGSKLFPRHRTFTRRFFYVHRRLDD
jgi:hypothetical protein